MVRTITLWTVIRIFEFVNTKKEKKENPKKKEEEEIKLRLQKEGRKASREKKTQHNGSRNIIPVNHK